MGYRFEKPQFWVNSFGQYLWGTIFGNAAFGSRFAKWLWGTVSMNKFQNHNFGVIALENNFGAQIWGAALGSNFGQLSGPALRQLRGSAILRLCSSIDE